MDSDLLSVSWNFDLTDTTGGCALGNEIRQHLQRFPFSFRLDRPPDRVSTGAARGESPTVAKWAIVSFEGCEDDSTLVRRVPVFELEARHAMSFRCCDPTDIGRHPDTGP
jgi:hypothetical protein